MKYIQCNIIEGIIGSCAVLANYIRNLELEAKYPPDERQLEFFEKRQNEHEERVKKNARKLVKNFPEIKQLLKHVVDHDSGKHEGEQKFCYIWLTSYNDLGYEYPSKELQDYIYSITSKHYITCPHHAEYWMRKNKLDMMPNVELAHMVCDWAAMSQEFGTSIKAWFNRVVPKKYPFSEQQQVDISRFISTFI